MEHYIKSALIQLDCTPKEIRLFTASYKHGPANSSELAKLAKLQRSTCYIVAEQLLKKGLLTQDFGQYNKKLTAIDPQTLIRLLKTKQRQVGRSTLQIEDHLSELTQAYNTPEALPRVVSYRGPNGLLAVWKEILASQTEVLLWTNQETQYQVFPKKQHEQFIAERVAKNIAIRVLAIDNPDGRALLASDAANLRQTQLLPPATTFSAETFIFDNKIAVLDYNTDLIAVVIENSLICQAQKAIFALAWQTNSPQ